MGSFELFCVNSRGRIEIDRESDGISARLDGLGNRLHRPALERVEVRNEGIRALGLGVDQGNIRTAAVFCKIGVEPSASDEHYLILGIRCDLGEEFRVIMYQYSALGRVIAV